MNENTEDWLPQARVASEALIVPFRGQVWPTPYLHCEVEPAPGTTGAEAQDKVRYKSASTVHRLAVLCFSISHGNLSSPEDRAGD